MPKGNHGDLLKKGKYLSRYKLGEEPRSPTLPHTAPHSFKHYMEAALRLGVQL
jgi:hypothetical protein